MVKPLRRPARKRRSPYRPTTVRKEYGGLKLDQAKRLKSWKKRTPTEAGVAELSLEKQVLKMWQGETSKPERRRCAVEHVREDTG